MGICNFGQLVEKYFATGITMNVPLSDFSGKKIAIDISMLYYAYIAKAKDIVAKEINICNETPNQDDINKTALKMLFMKILTFLKHKIIPVIVFDGTPHPLKLNCKEEREHKKQTATKSYELLRSQISLSPDEISEEKLRKAYKQINHIDSSFKKMCQDMIYAIGIPVIYADEFPIVSKDAEAVCACLSYNGLVHATFTEDSDYHTYGGRLAITEIVGDVCKVRDLKEMLDSKNMPFHCFQDLCILMGTDFNTKIKGKGPVANWDYIYKYGIIEHYLVGEGLSIDSTASCLKLYPEIRSMFRCTQLKINILPLIPNIERFLTIGIIYLTNIKMDGYVETIRNCYQTILS